MVYNDIDADKCNWLDESLRVLTSNFICSCEAARAGREGCIQDWVPDSLLLIVQVRVERKPKKKGYMRLHTNLGDLNLELHCDITPRACENFMILADSGYYTGTVFHRSIKNFMIQVLLPPPGRLLLCPRVTWL